MGIFGKQGNKSTEAKGMVGKLLLDSGVPDSIVDDIERLVRSDMDSWLVSSTGYYDTHKRAIVVFEDGVSIFKYSAAGIAQYPDVIDKLKKGAKKPECNDLKTVHRVNFYDDVFEYVFDKNKTECVTFYFNKYGFTPLAGYYDPVKEIFISVSEIMEPMANAISDRLISRVPGLKKCQANSGFKGEINVFTCEYEVAPMQWKTWFGGDLIEH